jgi:uncharacterized protein (DUF1800 family)
LPPECLTRRFKVANDPVSNLIEFPTHTWLERSGNVAALYEQVFVQDDGWTMTLIAIDEENDEDEPPLRALR